MDEKLEVPVTRSIDEAKVEVTLGEKLVDGEELQEGCKFDKKVDRKFDLYIIPWLFGIW